MDFADNTFVLGVPSNFARDWIEVRFSTAVREALAAVLGSDVKLKVVVDPQAETAGEMTGGETSSEAADQPQTQTSAHSASSGSGSRRRQASARPPNLNPRYIFDRFVVGPHNEYAAAVARSVAEAPAVAYNPVFLYSDTGLGKTHLVQAIGHEVAARHPGLRVNYVTCEQFTDDFISGVTEKGRIEGFKQKYRANDVLIVDDVQFLAGKQGTQVEFFQTFNSLYEANKQIIMTSDRQPRELEELEERLRSRFGQGVVVDICLLYTSPSPRD